MSQDSPHADGLPLVLQVGFVGARTLCDATLNPGVDPLRFEQEAQRQFTAILKTELARLGLGPQRFACGISSIAIGGDAIFTRACRELGLLQRIFLPLPREEFLGAIGSQGPDFNEAQKAMTRELLGEPRVIQERVVSDAADRHDRFHDVNLEIVRVTDVLICLVRVDQTGQRGSSVEARALALKRKRPVLEITMSVKDSAPVLTPVWHGLDQFHVPSLPRGLAGARLPAGATREPHPLLDDYARGLADLFSRHANWERSLFTFAALIIIAAHVLATILAVLALRLHGDWMAWLLGTELAALAIGFSVHQYLHHSHRVQRWALARLAAEIARSVSSIGPLHLYLDYLFVLPFPMSLRPLLRTLNVLHLRATVTNRKDVWKPTGEAKRDAYLHNRLTAAEAQLHYNQQTHDVAVGRLRFARYAFIFASLLAFFATLTKLLGVLHQLPLDEGIENTLEAVMGFLAIVLPVIAVASLSLAAAFDLEARIANAREMLQFLSDQKLLLENAASEREYCRLLIETEARLLGETVNWYGRRSFLGVA